jgi:hypothetical protein
MNRVQNHKEGGIGSIYDRHSYADENRRVMEAVAQHLVSLAEGGAADSKSFRSARATQDDRGTRAFADLAPQCTLPST